MNQKDKGTLKALWGMRHLSVDECLAKITAHPDLQFLLTTVGIWFLLRLVVGVWIGAHVLYFIYRIFHLVLA
jgi:hypothetical protein